MANFSLFGQFSKIEPLDDGTLIVSGVASSETVDSDGESIQSSAIQASIPSYMAWGAVREMHSNIAAGSALSLKVDELGQAQFEAHIVDASTVKKINSGVLKGFSVGGKVTARDPLNKRTITGIKLVEISVVDRPSNPDCRLSIAKFEESNMSDETLAKATGYSAAKAAAVAAHDGLRAAWSAHKAAAAEVHKMGLDHSKTDCAKALDGLKTAADGLMAAAGVHADSCKSFGKLFGNKDAEEEKPAEEGKEEPNGDEKPTEEKPAEKDTSTAAAKDDMVAAAKAELVADLAKANSDNLAKFEALGELVKAQATRISGLSTLVEKMKQTPAASPLEIKLQEKELYSKSEKPIEVDPNASPEAQSVALCKAALRNPKPY